MFDKIYFAYFAVRLLGNGIQSHQAAKTFASPDAEEEPFESLEELEAKTIGNLLPLEDDLFSGVTSELRRDAYINNGEDLEDFDLFSSGGGMELERDGVLGVSKCQEASNGSIVGEHPSRTLSVRNINSSIEDSELKVLFEVHVIQCSAII